MKRLLAILAMFFAVGATAQEIPAPAVVNTNDFRARVEGAFEWEPVKNLSLEAGVDTSTLA